MKRCIRTLKSLLRLTSKSAREHFLRPRQLRRRAFVAKMVNNFAICRSCQSLHLGHANGLGANASSITVYHSQMRNGPKRTFIPTSSAALRLHQTGHSLRVLKFSYVPDLLCGTMPTLPITFRTAAIRVLKRKQPQLRCQEFATATASHSNQRLSGQGAPDATQFKKALTVSWAEWGGTSRPGPGSQAQSTSRSWPI